MFRRDDINEEEHNTPFNEFHKKLGSEGWKELGHKLMIMK
jgi:hypothetical protein